jgi:hypothetical protein
MNKELLFFMELDDEKTELLIKHSSYSDKSLRNIKSRTERKISSTGKRFHKRVLIAAAALVLLGAGAAAAAVNLDAVYRTLFGEQAAYMRNHSQAADIAAETEGIEVKLLSTFRYAGSLTMLVSIRDTEGDRIDETTAFDSIVDFGGEGRTRLKSPDEWQSAFDEETGEFIRVETVMLPMGFEVGDVTYTVANLRSRRVDRGGPEAQIDLYGFVSKHRPSTVVPESPEFAKALAPEETHIPFSDVDWSYISNMGFVDGAFHIQIKDDPFIINYARKRGFLFPIYLIDSNGTKYEPDKQYKFPVVQYWDEDGDAYSEYIFESITDVAQLSGLTLVKEGHEYTETFDAGWSLDAYAETVEAGGSLDAGWFFKLRVPPDEAESLTIPVEKEIPVAKGKELYAESIVVTPLYVNVTYLTENLVNGRLFNSLGIPGGVMTFYYPEDDPDKGNFISYDDGTIFEFELQQESFSEYSDALGMYKANVRYSKAIILSDDIIEVDRVRSVTLQGVEFEVE